MDKKDKEDNPGDGSGDTPRPPSRSRAIAAAVGEFDSKPELLAVIVELSYEADRFEVLDDDREWLDELAIDARGDITPATMVILGLAAAELRTAPSVLALEGTRPYGVHGLLNRADALRCAFAELGSKGGSARGSASTRSA